MVDQAVRYLVRRRGKALRPFLVLASARLFGKPSLSTYRACLIVELLHTATLVHDDVVDKSTMRRRFPSLNHLWGNKFSILFGDYLLAHSLAAMLEERSLPLLDILATTSKRMSRGQLLELTRTRRGDISEESYFDTIADKTAALMRACCQLGALSLDEDDGVQLALAEYGESVGIAFQIRDDILDYTGRTRILGKRVGEDIRDKKITLPFIAAFQHAQEGERKEMLALIRRGAKGKDISLIIKFVRTNGGIDYAREKAMRYGQRAEEALSNIPDSDSKNILIQFIQYAIHREK